jgi:hypothetical protein
MLYVIPFLTSQLSDAVLVQETVQFSFLIPQINRSPTKLDYLPIARDAHNYNMWRDNYPTQSASCIRVHFRSLRHFDFGWFYLLHCYVSPLAFADRSWFYRYPTNKPLSLRHIVSSVDGHETDPSSVKIITLEQ